MNITEKIDNYLNEGSKIPRGISYNKSKNLLTIKGDRDVFQIPVSNLSKFLTKSEQEMDILANGSSWEAVINISEPRKKYCKIEISTFEPGADEATGPYILADQFRDLVTQEVPKTLKDLTKELESGKILFFHDQKF